MNTIQTILNKILSVLLLSVSLFFLSGCGWFTKSPTITERIAETPFIAKVSGQAKRDEIVKQKYKELLEKKKTPAGNNVAENNTPQETENSNSIQQIGYEVPSETKNSKNVMTQNELALAQNALMQKNYTEASSLYKNLLLKDPSNSMIHHRLGIISDELNDFASAEFHYRTALLTRPNDPNLLSDMGYSFLLQGKYPLSEEFLTKAVQVDPNHVRALDNLGYLYGKMSRFDVALNYFRRTGSEVEAQRKLLQVQSEMQNPVVKSPAMTVQAPQNLVPNNQNDYTEIPSGPVPNTFNVPQQLQTQQIPANLLQAPNPVTPQGVPDQQYSQYQSVQNETYSNQSSQVQTIQTENQSSNLDSNQINQIPDTPVTQTPSKPFTVEHYKGGKLIKPGDTSSNQMGIQSGTKQAFPLKSGHSIHSISPEETWPPAELIEQQKLIQQQNQIPQNNQSVIQETTYQSNNPNTTRHAIYSYPYGQKPNHTSNIPTQWNQQNAPIQETAAIIGMNAGPGGMFPVMNKNQVANPNTSMQVNQVPAGNQQIQNSQTVWYPQQDFQGNPDPSGNPLTQQNLNYNNQINNQVNNQMPTSFQNSFQQNTFPQNQQFQQNQVMQNQIPQNYQNGSYQNQVLQTRNMNTEQYSDNGLEVNRNHHLMQPSPLQVYEQQYHDDMEKARNDEGSSF